MLRSDRHSLFGVNRVLGHQLRIHIVVEREGDILGFVGRKLHIHRTAAYLLAFLRERLGNQGSLEGLGRNHIDQDG